MKRFFEPRSIAVVGASGRRGSIGGEVFHNLLASGFPGPVYPVIAGADGARVVDARIRVEPRDPPPPEGSRPRARGIADA